MAEAAAHSEEHHDHTPYVRIWGILVVLLVISVMGPLLEIRVVTLIAAFGIAIVKAYMVAKNFMHVNVEPRFVVYLLATMLVFVLLFFAGVSPDVMRFEGVNWTKPIQSTAAPGTLGHPDFVPHGEHGEAGGEPH
jgi:caa(3)-type oxidase subunit IV